MSVLPSHSYSLPSLDWAQLCDLSTLRQTTHTCLGPVREELGQRDMSTGFYQSAWNLQNNLPLDEDQKESAVPAILESRLKHLDAKIFVPHVDEATEWYAESEGTCRTGLDGKPGERALG